MSGKLFLPCFSSFPILVKHSTIVCKILSLDILQISIALCFTRIGKEEEQGRKSFPLTLMVFLFHESEAFLISLCCSGYYVYVWNKSSWRKLLLCGYNVKNIYLTMYLLYWTFDEKSWFLKLYFMRSREWNVFNFKIFFGKSCIFVT